MASPDNLFAFDYEVARQAAVRWKDTEQSREEKATAFEQHQFDKVDSKERLAKRYNRLANAIRRVAGATSMEEAIGDLPETMSAADIDNFAMERVIGASRDFLQFRYLTRALKAGRSVCRLVTVIGNGRVAYGTGFLVSPRLLLTNHHVLSTAQAASVTRAQFNYELDDRDQVSEQQEFSLEPARFFLNDKAHDFALVAITAKSKSGAAAASFGFCQLIAAEGKIIPGERVNIIQHPKGEPKQIVLQENKLLDLPPKHDRYAYYEADTEPGSSGSPVLNDQWEVVALHHSGVPRTNSKGELLDKDGAVVRKDDDPSRIQWIGNEGIRVSRLLRFIASAKVSAEEEELRKEVLRDYKPPPLDPDTENDESDERTRPSHRADRPAPSRGSATAKVSLTVPLVITVTLGGGQGDDLNIDESAAAAEESGRPDDDYDDRPGFDENFLGVPVPLPTVSGQRGRAPVELKYYKYSVIFSSDRRLAHVSAVNFNATAPARTQREGADRWYFDPRMARTLQAGEALYKGNKLDRGHLTRRADAAWGETEEEAERANNDTFHWTNCSPQHEIYNQSTKANKKGVKLWGNIEGHIAKEASREGKLIVFNGPVFRSDDRTYRGIKLPKEYWKVVVSRGDGKDLKAMAFRLSQESLIKDLPNEEFEEGPYKPFQMKISDLEALTKLDFGDLRRFDPLSTPERESQIESALGTVPIESFSDIVLG